MSRDPPEATVASGSGPSDGRSGDGTIDVDRARAETPGVPNVLHFNNAGAALVPRPVLDACVGHLEREARVGGYEAADLARDEIEATYDALSRLLGCSPGEIAVTESATRAWDMAFYSLDFEAGDRILTSPASYASNYIAFLQVARRTGARVDVVPADSDGQVDVDALRERVDDRVRLVALTHVPTNGGLVNPAAAVGRVAREAGVPFLLDACQSAGQMPLDVDQIGCDMLSATSRKFLRGPRGMGFLYVDRSMVDRLDPPFLDLHAARWEGPDAYSVREDARRFEQWERNYAAHLGLGRAVDYALEWGLDAIWARVRSLADRLRAGLEEEGLEVRDRGRVRCGIVTFTVEGREAEAVQRALRERDINVSVSPRSHSLLDAEARRLPDLVRASVHYYNTEDEVDRFCGVVAGLA